MKQMYRSLCLPLLTAMLLAACSVNPRVAPVPENEELYLRGVFSWWEADEQFRMRQSQPGVYLTEVELIADGQPYDFRVADRAWSKGRNCGYAHKKDESIRLGIAVQANCHGENNNFKFTPKRTAVYQFTVTFNQANEVWLKVEEK